MTPRPFNRAASDYYAASGMVTFFQCDIGRRPLAMLVTIERIEALVCVIETGSFSAAARRMGKTPSAGDTGK